MQESLAALALVSHTCNEVATPWLYRLLKLDFSTRHFISALTRTFPYRHSRVQGVATLFVQSLMFQVGDRCDNPHLWLLKHLQWEYISPLSKNLKHVLQNHSEVKDLLSQSNSISATLKLVDLHEPDDNESGRLAGFEMIVTTRQHLQYVEDVSVTNLRRIWPEVCQSVSTSTWTS